MLAYIKFIDMRLRSNYVNEIAPGRKKVLVSSGSPAQKLRRCPGRAAEAMLPALSTSGWYQTVP